MRSDEILLMVLRIWLSKDISIDAFKTGLSMNDMINHFKPGSPVFNITKEGTVSNIYIKTQDG